MFCLFMIYRNFTDNYAFGHAISTNNKIMLSVIYPELN